MRIDGLQALVAEAAAVGTAEARWRAVAAVSPDLVEELLHGSADASATGAQVVAAGVAASPGAGSGVLCLSVDDVLDAVDAGRDAVLVCVETTPADEVGMRLAVGIVTARGGTASHAAVVARGWGIPAVVGVDGLEVADDHVVAGGRRIERGAEVGLDGGTGEVFSGALDGGSGAGGSVGGEVPELEVLLGWADEVRGDGVDEALVPHRTFPGDRPSTTVLLPELTPSTLGQLVALAENRTVAAAALLGVNPFDQWGVELGKQTARDLADGSVPGSELLRRARALRDR